MKIEKIAKKINRVAGCGIARTYYLWKLNHTYDTSWVAFDLFMWSLLECHLGIIFACAPSLRAFVRRYVADKLGSSFRSSNKNSSKASEKLSEHPSTARSGKVTEDLELGQNAVEQRVLTKPSRDHMDAESEVSSIRSADSDEPPRVRSADASHSYALQHMSRYGKRKFSNEGQATAGASEPSRI